MRCVSSAPKESARSWRPKHQADELGIRFGVVSDSKVVLRPLEMTAVDQLLLVFPNVEGAVTALSA